MNYITWVDWVITILMFISFVFWANNFVKKNSHDPLIKNYFKKGLYLKVVGSIAFAVYHGYVYGGGDTFGYYMTGQTLNNVFFDSPTDYFNLTFLSLEQNSDIIDNVKWLWPDEIMWQSEANYFSSRLAGFIQFFTFRTYIPTGIIFSLLSFWGIWKCFKFFANLYPEYHTIVAISFLYFPTVVFWGSGMGKDSLTLGAVCGLAVCTFQVFLFRKQVFKNTLGIIFTCLVLFVLKPYIPLSFSLPLAIAVALKFIGRIKNPLLKIATVPIVLVITAGLGAVFSNYIQSNFAQFTVESLTNRIYISTTALQEAGSAYDLGIQPENIIGISDMLPFFPSAVIASWYRPWLWEARNPAMLLSALESAFMLSITIIVLFKGYILKTIYVICSNAVLFSLFVYAFIFSGLIGLSTGNFGTLVRYKIPMLPFLVLILLITNKVLSKKKVKVVDTQ